jgi:hypothetical protein
MAGGRYQRSKEEDHAEVRAVHERMLASISSLVPHWYGNNARKSGQDYYLGSIDGEPGQSLKIWGKSGIWKDYNPGAGRATGDLLHLAAHMEFGGRMGDAIAHYKSHYGLDSKDPKRIAIIKREAAEAQEKRAKADAADEAATRNKAFQLWQGSKAQPTPPVARTPAFAYLCRRVPGFEALGRAPRSLRYRPDVWCSARRIKSPAMLGGIFALDGTFLAVHRTYLDLSDWDEATQSGIVRNVKLPDAKGKIKSHKMSFGRFGVGGGSIPIWKGASRTSLAQVPPGTDIFISEAIEKAFAWAVTHPEHHVRCAVSLDNMANFIMPEQAGRLIILGDNDDAGSDAQATLFERVLKAQQERLGVDRTALVFPPAGYKGFDDFLTGERIAA